MSVASTTNDVIVAEAEFAFRHWRELFPTCIVLTCLAALFTRSFIEGSSMRYKSAPATLERPIMGQVSVLGNFRSNSGGR